MKAPATPAVEPRATHGPRPATYELIERIVGLQLRQAPLDVLSEDVLPPLLDAFGSSAGGLLLYHSDARTLELSASCGLSPAGRQHLAIIQSGPASSWEIPMHGLLNRKAYIIERPHEHPFVPELIAREDATPITNLASIPLYRGQLPVGVLLVIAGRRPLTNAEIMAHVLVYDVLALALDSGMRTRGEVPQPLTEDDLASVRVTTEAWVDPNETARGLEDALDELEQERDRLGARVLELEAREAEHARVLEAARVDTERRVQELRAASEDAQRQVEAVLVDRGANFESTVRKLQTALADRDALLAARASELADASDERDRVRQAAVEAGYIIQRLNGEIESIKDELAKADEKREHELAQTRVLYEGRIEEAEASVAARLDELQAMESDAEARIGAAEMRAADLARELEGARRELQRLHAEHEQVRTALDHPDGDAIDAIHGLRGRVVELEAELVTAAAERAASERRIAIEAQASESRLAAQQREIQELRAAHQHALGEIHGAHRREVEEIRSAHQRELDEGDAAHRSQLGSVREELQARIEQTRNEGQARLDAARTELERSLQVAQSGQEEALTRATIAEKRLEALADDLERARVEVARLHEERQHVLAVVDDPGAEPAAVITALREQVVALEGQVSAFAAERASFERRAASDAESVAMQIAEVRGQAEATLEEARALIRTRDASLAERERLVASLVDERDRTRQEATEAGDLVRRLQAEVKRAQTESDGVRTTHADLLARAAEATGRAEALDGELATIRAQVERLHEERERVLAAVEDQGSEPAAVIRALRDQVADLERRVEALGFERAAAERRATADAAALEDVRAAHRHEREAAESTHRRELEDARNTIERLSAQASQRSALDERLAAAERERATAERERLEQAARVAMLERELSRSEEMLASTQPPAADAVALDVVEPVVTPVVEAPPVREAATLAPAPPTVHVLEPPAPIFDIGTCRIIERDADMREAVAASLTATPPPQKDGESFIVVNLLAAIPGRLPDLEEAARTRTKVVAYAADGERSRILGPVLCFAEPPTAAEVLASVDGGGSRRIVTLSDDVDALAPARAALTKAGHKVSMACDTKQALDLLTMLTPDVVVVDLRSTPESAADFLGALALEGGYVRLVLVYGERDGGTLKRAIDRLLRPKELDAAELVETCAGALGAKPPEPAKPPTSTSKVVRPLDRNKPAARKPLARRVMTKR